MWGFERRVQRPGFRSWPCTLAHGTSSFWTSASSSVEWAGANVGGQTSFPPPTTPATLPFFLLLFPLIQAHTCFKMLHICFLSGCESSLLHAGFLQLHQVQLLSSCDPHFSWWWPLSLQVPGTWALWLQRAGLVARRQVGSSQPETEPASRALAGGFSATETPGRSLPAP